MYMTIGRESIKRIWDDSVHQVYRQEVKRSKNVPAPSPRDDGWTLSLILLILFVIIILVVLLVGHTK